MKTLNFTTILFSSILILYYGKFFLLPLFLALFFYIVINAISQDLIKLTKKYFFKINEGFSFFLIFLSSIILAYFLFQLFKINLQAIIENSQQYQKNLNIFIELSSKYMMLDSFLSENVIEKINLISFLSNLLNFIKSFAGNFSLVLIYLIFIIIEEKFFKIKLNLLLKSQNKKKFLQKLTTIYITILELKSLQVF